MGLFSQSISFSIEGPDWKIVDFKTKRCIPNEPFFYSAVFALSVAWFYQGMSGASRLFGDLYLRRLKTIGSSKSIGNFDSIASNASTLTRKATYSVIGSDKFNSLPPRIKMPLWIDPRWHYIAPLRYIEFIYNRIGEDLRDEYCELIAAVHEIAAEGLDYPLAYGKLNVKYRDLLMRD